MLRRAELAVCGGARRPPWEHARGDGVPGGASPPPLKGGEPRRGGSRSRWPPGRRGRHPGVSRKLLGSRTHSHYQHWQHQQQLQQHCRAFRRCQRPRVLLSLRPVNVLGRRAPGMRAPRNTNQFLMREKYQLMHLRSDSVGTESGGSDCEMDPLDMDSYLGVLENARGALMECTGEARPASSPSARCPTGTGAAAGPLQEESQQYFPSEDDVIESELFMERDFDEFCSRIA
ncbi:uncharacterized protein AAGF69_010700 isoform 1-T2 [Amazona ochrocephala]